MKNLNSARLVLALVAAVALPAVAQNVAVVNGKAIPTSRVDAMVKQMVQQGQKDSPEMRAMIKDELINREVLAQEADRQGVANRPEIKNQIDLARQSIVIRALAQEFVAKNPVKDEELKAEYDKFKATQSGKEYRARHILVETEEQAKSLLAEIKKGGKFEELAKKHSKDPGSGANGGDLDWANASSYVAEFSNAMVKLGKGELSEAPVKSQFGWHIIRVDDLRDAQLPKLEEVKPQIAQQLQQQKMAKFQEDLRAKARIQ